MRKRGFHSGLTDAEKEQILMLHQKGVSQHKIATTLKRSQSFISNQLKEVAPKQKEEEAETIFFDVDRYAKKYLII